MSKWGQDAERIARLREGQASDVERWSTLDNHNEGWINRAQIALKSIPPGATVVELGAGRAFLRELLPSSCTYLPVDLVAHAPDFLVVDLNDRDWQLPASDAIVALGTFEYIYDFFGVLRKLRSNAKRIIFTYCCRVDGSDPGLRMRQGWLTDFTQAEVEQHVAAAGLKVTQKIDFQKEVHFTQIMWVTDVDPVAPASTMEA